VLVCLLLEGLFLTQTALATGWPPPKIDSAGHLLPYRSYRRTIERAMRFVLEDPDGWDKDNNITAEDGKTRPPYFFYCVAIDGRHHGVGQSSSANTSYPAFHHAIAIEAFLAYHGYCGNTEAVKRARDLADWNIAHSTPADWKYGSLPYSTAHNGRPGGSVDGDALMTDKPAIMGAAYLHLYDVTHDATYLAAATRIAETLARTQRPEGNWPFRVNPQTGAVRELYTSSAIYAVELFERLDAMDAEKPRYIEPKKHALRWLLDGPVRTMNWNGFYEDVTQEMGATNRTNYDCIDTARYLVRHRADDASYLPNALKLHDWVKATFVDEKNDYAPAEAVREQLACNYRMVGHGIHWAMLLADLYDATGDEQYRTRALNIASAVTYVQLEDGRMPISHEWDEAAHGFWYSGQFAPVRFLIELKTNKKLRMGE
jgi:hypothetical protein